MARKPRFNLVGVPQHVIQRGNNREPCFYSEEDYTAYLEFVKIAADKTACQVHAYVNKLKFLCSNKPKLSDN